MKLAIAVLAAGSSSRMGEPKQLLPWGDTFLLNKVLQTIAELQASKKFIVLGANSKAILAELPQGLDHVLNNSYTEGLSTSLITAIQAIESDNHTHLLIVLGDQPGIELDYFRDMIVFAKANSTSIIASNYELRAGVPAIIPIDYLEELKMKCKGDMGGRAFFEANRADTLLMPLYERLYDIDTKEDYEKYKPG